jgi:glutamate-5-semialdehyde dehydrogenase
MTSPTDMRALAAATAQAAPVLAALESTRKDALLADIATRIEADVARVLAANAEDVAAARAAGQTDALVDRLLLTPARLAALAAAVREIVALPDPVGSIAWQPPGPRGLEIGRMRVPLGVIAMIYEARPNVTIDAAALCLKSGNAAILRGGSEARASNAALAALVGDALEAAGLPRAAVTAVPTTERAALVDLLKCDDLVDLVIPRGGEGLIRFVAAESRIPVIRHYKGVCHLYVDAAADLDKAIALLVDGKTSRPAVCNALETLLVDAAIATAFLPRAAAALAARGVTLHADARALPLLPGAQPAAAADWDAEYLDLVLAVAVVDGLDGALAHIARHGSRHTEVICTEDSARAARFVREVDASAVMVNASSRFNDGGELGLGAEIGISTTKLHAYGPMGLEALTTQKWVVRGSGQVRHAESLLAP